MEIENCVIKERTGEEVMGCKETVLTDVGHCTFPLKDIRGITMQLYTFIGLWLWGNQG